MTAFAKELTREGKLRRGGALQHASESVRVRMRDGRAFVTDGPFAESKEVVAGFWVVDVAGRDEAIAIARRAPHARRAGVEVHPLAGRWAFADSGTGAPYLLAFRMEPGLALCDGEKMQEMIGFAEDLARQGLLFETAPLGDVPPPARVEPHAGGMLVSDGPFPEAKEAVGGYSLLRVDGRAQAVALAKRYPHARWGPVEVREVAFLDPV
jgi:hypothetical protein